MRKLFIIGSFIFFSQAFGQSAESRHAIKANFSMDAIAAYQESSASKISDFYQFLEILSSSSSSASLKQEVLQSILLLTEGDILVKDITSSDASLIKLKSFVEKISDKNLQFKVSGIKSGRPTVDHWIDSYQIEITNLGQALIHTIDQKIIFRPEEKSFGKSHKEVWTLLLGNMQ